MKIHAKAKDEVFWQVVTKGSTKDWSTGLRHFMTAGLVLTLAFAYSVKVVRADGEVPGSSEIISAEPGIGPDAPEVAPDIVLNDEVESVTDILPLDGPPDAGDNSELSADPGLPYGYPPMDCDPFIDGENPCPVSLPVFEQASLMSSEIVQPVADCDPFTGGENPCPNQVRAMTRPELTESNASTRPENTRSEKMPALVVLESPSETVLAVIVGEPEPVTTVENTSLLGVSSDGVITSVALQAPDAQMLVVGDDMFFEEGMQGEILSAPVQTSETPAGQDAIEFISNNLITIGRLLFPDMLGVCSDEQVAGSAKGFFGMIREYIRSLGTCGSN